MTREKISEYDAVASNNTDVNGVNIAENCPPSGMNNMGREIMAALKRFQTGSDGDGVTVGGNLVVSGSSTLATTAISSADINGGTIDGAAIGGASAAAGAFTTLNTSGAVVFNDAGADVDFRVEGDTDANLLFVDASADAVGIGTSSPGYRLQVTTASAGAVSRWNYTGGTRGARIEFGLNETGSGIENYIDFSGTSGTSAGAFRTSGAEVMRIDSSGNLLVGTTSATEGGASNFSVFKANFLAQYGMAISTTQTSGTGAMIQFVFNGSQVGAITSTSTATNYATSSDYRLKNTIIPMTDALARVALLKPCTYKWNVDGSDGEGFIAHELQEVAPYAVTGEKDGEEMQGVDYGKITPLLTAALQEAIAEIQSLKARVAELEAK
jgi:hypothetical protein